MTRPQAVADRRRRGPPPRHPGGEGVPDGDLGGEPPPRAGALEATRPPVAASTTDAVVGPRLGGYRVTYFRPGLEKFPEFGYVIVGHRRRRSSEPVSRARAEEKGAQPDIADLRPAADRFAASRAFPGAPRPEFDSARPNVLRDRTDHVFRYRVPHAGPPSDRLLLPERLLRRRPPLGVGAARGVPRRPRLPLRAGREPRHDPAEFAAVFGLLFLLLAIFLKKYHAGEVGVGTGAWLFGGQLLLLLLVDLAVYRAQGYGVGFGGTDAFQTAAAQVAFRFLFFDVPLATLVFLSWSVGESYARERWGERLASFDALLRRDPFNATVGGSLLTGLLVSPAVAAAALVPFLPSLALGKARSNSRRPLGPGPLVRGGAGDGGPRGARPPRSRSPSWRSSSPSRRSTAAASSRSASSPRPSSARSWPSASPPSAPRSSRFLLGFGAPLAAAGVFLASDLLAAAVSLFGATLLLALLPLLRAFEGPALGGTAAALLVPLLVLLALAVAGLATRTDRRVPLRGPGALT